MVVTVGLLGAGLNGIQVTALKITLLDGSGAIFNLGFARAGFSRAGL